MYSISVIPDNTIDHPSREYFSGHYPEIRIATDLNQGLGRYGQLEYPKYVIKNPWNIVYAKYDWKETQFWCHTKICGVYIWVKYVLGPYMKFYICPSVHMSKSSYDNCRKNFIHWFWILYRQIFSFISK